MNIPISLVIGSIAQLIAIYAMGASAWRFSALFAETDAPRHDRWLMASILFFSAIVVLIELLGIAGLLAHPIAPFLASCALFGASRFLPASAPPTPAPPPIRPGPVTPETIPSVTPANRSDRPFGLNVAIFWVVLLCLPFLMRTLLIVPVDWDSLTYHLYKPVRWLQDGRIVHPIGGQYPYYHLSFMPANYETVIAFFCAIIRNDLFSEVINLPLIALIGVACATLCQRLGGTTIVSISCAVALVTTPALFSWSATAYVEPLVDFSIVAAVIYVIDAFREPTTNRFWKNLVLAGFAIGLATGAKYSTLYLAALLGLLVALIAFAKRRDLLFALRAIALFTGAALLTGGYWYVRNGLVTGNPVYPVPLGSLHAITEIPLKQATLWGTLGELIEDHSLWNAIVGTPGSWFSRMAIGWKTVLLVPLSLFGVGAFVRNSFVAMKHRTHDAFIGVIIVASAAVLLISYAALPYYRNLGWLQSNVRFLVPFFLILIPAAFASLSRHVRDPRWLILLALCCVGVDALFLDLSLLDRSPDTGRMVVAATALVGFLGLHLFRRFRFGERRIRHATVTLFLGSLLLPWPLLTYRERHRYDHYRQAIEVHPSTHRYFANVAKFLQRRQPGKTLAAFSTGYLEFLYLFVGPQFERRVRYIETHHGPPAFLDRRGDPRRHFDRDHWIANLRRENVELLLAMRWPDGILGPFPPELRWARELGFKPLYRDPFSILYQVDPKLLDLKPPRTP